MGMQNGSKLEAGIVDSHQVWHFEVSHVFVWGKPYICNVFHPHTTWVGVATHIGSGVILGWGGWYEIVWIYCETLAI